MREMVVQNFISSSIGFLWTTNTDAQNSPLRKHGTLTGTRSTLVKVLLMIRKRSIGLLLPCPSKRSYNRAILQKNFLTTIFTFDVCIYKLETSAVKRGFTIWYYHFCVFNLSDRRKVRNLYVRRIVVCRWIAAFINQNTHKWRVLCTNIGTDV